MSDTAIHAETLRSGPLHFQHDESGRPCRLWAGDAHIGRLVRVEASPYGALSQIGQWEVGPYRWDGAGSGKPRRLRLEHPWPVPPHTVSIPL